MERDDYIGGLFDAAEVDECDAHRQEQQRADDEREEALEAALDECLKLGLSPEHLKTLVFETSSTAWGLKHSLKTPEPKRKCVWPID
jgi:hypothetical protein